MGVLDVLIAAAQAETPPRSVDLRGNWVLRPYIWQINPVKGCRYEQWLHIERSTGPTRFTGRVRYRTTCGGRLAGRGSNRVVLTRTGNRVRIVTDSPSWIPENVRIVAPDRMDGKDERGHPIIYDRPKGPPTS